MTPNYSFSKKLSSVLDYTPVHRSISLSLNLFGDRQYNIVKYIYALVQCATKGRLKYDNVEGLVENTRYLIIYAWYHKQIIVLHYQHMTHVYI